MRHGFDIGRIRLVECCELVKKSSLDNLSEELRMLEKMTSTIRDVFENVNTIQKRFEATDPAWRGGMVVL